MTMLLMTFGLMAFIMLAMSVGVLFKRPCLRGSCGGPEVLGPDGESLSCSTCPRRKERQEGSGAKPASTSRLPVLD